MNSRPRPLLAPVTTSTCAMEKCLLAAEGEYYPSPKVFNHARSCQVWLGFSVRSVEGILLTEP